MKKVALLGATGSVAACALQVIDRFPHKFSLEAATAWSSVRELAAIAKLYRPALVAIGRHEHYKELKDELSGLKIEVVSGQEGLERAAVCEAELVIAATVGLAGLPAVLLAAAQGKQIALANKECIVAAGPVLLEAIKKGGATLLPVDSEHSALFSLIGGHSLLRPEALASVEKMTLTASGGPFWRSPGRDLGAVTPEEACTHPVWKMGAKISVDCATMANKAAELVEAHYLFGLPQEKIEILIHPEALIHAAVTYEDGTVHMNASVPDMRIPVAKAMFWPLAAERMLPPCDMGGACLSFAPPDDVRFPFIAFVRSLLDSASPLALTAFNAANESAVEAFMQRHIPFSAIFPLVCSVVESVALPIQTTLENILYVDALARHRARHHIARFGPKTVLSRTGGAGVHEAH